MGSKFRVVMFCGTSVAMISTIKIMFNTFFNLNFEALNRRCVTGEARYVQ